MKIMSCIGGIISMFAVAVTGTLAAEKESAPITIGVLENAAFAFAPMMKGSFDLAMQHINAENGINGRPIKLVYANDGGKKKMGIQAVKKLVKEDRAVMLVGGYSSSNTLFMAQTAERLDVPFLVCTAADDRITQRQKSNVFRLNPPASEYAKGLEDLLIERINPASMAILYENSPYGTGGAMRMMYFCRENDIEITAIVPYHRERLSAEKGPKADYLKRLIEPLTNDPPDVVYMVSYLKDGVELVKQIRAAKIDALFCGGAGGFTHPDFIEQAGAAAQHLLTATLWTPDQDDPLAQQYADQYRAIHRQVPDYHGAEAYSALLVAADALKRSTSLSAADIQQALKATNLKTPFGQVSFGSYGPYERQNSQVTLVLQAIGDHYQCVWPKAVSMANLVLPSR